MLFNNETKTMTLSKKFNEELINIPEDTKIIIFENFIHSPNNDYIKKYII